MGAVISRMCAARIRWPISAAPPSTESSWKSGGVKRMGAGSSSQTSSIRTYQLQHRHDKASNKNVERIRHGFARRFCSTFLLDGFVRRLFVVAGVGFEPTTPAL